MNNDKQMIQLDPLNKGDLLTEVVRAYMYGATPSALLYRVIEGLNQFLEDDDICEENRAFILEFVGKLQELKQTIRQKEDEIYA